MAKQNRLRAFGLGVVLLGVLAAGGCSVKTETPEHEPAFLFVQSSSGFEYDGDRLAVLGTSPTTIFFSDRPDRIAGHTSLEQAFEWGRSGDDSFLADPPNATFSILEKGEVGNVVVTMFDAIIDGDSISFDVEILEGDLPARGGANTLFIDIIGRPLTPLSVAGVRRRTRRRSLAVGMMVGASAASASSYAAQSASASADQAADAANSAADAAQSAADAADSANSETAEQQLAQLKDMLDKGLITQQDYDAKKKQLLSAM